VSAVYRVELAKVSAQLLPRLAAVVCLLGPFVFALIMRSQTSAPADTLFGRWVTSSGSLSLVVLGFAGSRLPAAHQHRHGRHLREPDRLSHWKTVLTRSSARRALLGEDARRRDVHRGHRHPLLAVAAWRRACSSSAEPLIGLSGALLSPGRAFVLVAGPAIALLRCVHGPGRAVLGRDPQQPDRRPRAAGRRR
jgi:ABC-2 type transport system permease protein